MRFTALALGVLLGVLAAPHALAQGEAPQTFRDRPQVGQPVRFTDAAGHVFQPDRLVVLGREGARVASLPATTRRARSEDRVDLSGLPLLGHLFRDRLAPGDARRRGVLVGPLARIGDALVLDARESPIAVAPREIMLTANFPRTGAVSYRLRGLAFSPSAAPRETGRPAGHAWLIGSTLVLAGPGYEPAIEDLEGAIGELLR